MLLEMATHQETFRRRFRQAPRKKVVMAKTPDPTERYALIGHNQISIADGTDAEADLFREIESLFSKEESLLQNVKDTRFRLYIIAASLRKRYWNAKTNKYDQAFHEWYGTKGRNLNRFFKTFPNFTKYAAAGDLVNYVATQSATPDDDLAKLPPSLLTLYHLHLVKNGLIEQNHERVFWTLFVSTPKRKSRPDKSIKFDKTPLIHGERVVKLDDGTNDIQPATIAQDIIDWWSTWNNPVATQKSKNEFSIPVATIYAHKSLFSFNRQGDHDGTVDLADITKLMREVRSYFTTRNSAKFRIETEVADVTDRYTKRKKQKHPERKIATKKK
jgi:hypothetical protein